MQTAPENEKNHVKSGGPHLHKHPDVNYRKASCANPVEENIPPLIPLAKKAVSKALSELLFTFTCWKGSACQAVPKAVLQNKAILDKSSRSMLQAGKELHRDGGVTQPS